MLMGFAAIRDAIACVNHVCKMRRVFRMGRVRLLWQGPIQEPSVSSSRAHLVVPQGTAMVLALARFTQRAPFASALTAMAMTVLMPAGVMVKGPVLRLQIAGRAHLIHALGALASQTAMATRTVHRGTAVKPQTRFVPT